MFRWGWLRGGSGVGQGWLTIHRLLSSPVSNPKVLIYSMCKQTFECIYYNIRTYRLQYSNVSITIFERIDYNIRTYLLQHSNVSITTFERIDYNIRTYLLQHSNVSITTFECFNLIQMFLSFVLLNGSLNSRNMAPTSLHLYFKETVNEKRKTQWRITSLLKEGQSVRTENTNVICLGGKIIKVLTFKTQSPLCVCVYACVRACVHARVRVCVTFAAAFNC